MANAKKKKEYEIVAWLVARNLSAAPAKKDGIWLTKVKGCWPSLEYLIGLDRLLACRFHTNQRRPVTSPPK